MTVKLTGRESQVLHGMAEGKSNAAIGRGLYIAEDSVKSHARKLFRKLGAADRAHAVALGYRRGLLVADDPAVEPVERVKSTTTRITRPPCHPYRDTRRSVRLVADDHDAALLSSAMFGPRPNDPGVALRRSRAALERLVGAT